MADMLTPPEEELTSTPSELEKPEEEVVVETGIIKAPQGKGIQPPPPPVTASTMSADLNKQPKLRSAMEPLLKGTNSPDIDSLVPLGQSKENDKRNDQIINSLITIKDVAAATSVAKSIANSPLPSVSNGSVLVDITTQGLPKETREELSSHIDAYIRRTELETATIIGLRGEGYTGTYYDMLAEKDQDVKDAAKVLQSRNPDLPYDGSADDVDSVGGFINWINPVGEETDGMDVEVWEFTKSIFSGDLEYDKFDKQMTSNWGDNWEGRFAGYLAKEVAIDAALLFIAFAIPGVGSIFSAGVAATRKARLGAALARSALYGVGGGSVQAMQNVYLDREANLGTEVAMRSVGALGGEAVFFGAKAAIGMFKSGTAKAATQAIAKENNVTVLGKETTETVKDPKKTPPPPLAAHAGAELEAEKIRIIDVEPNKAEAALSRDKANILGTVSTKLQELAGDTVDTILKPASPESKKLVAEILTRDGTQADNLDYEPLMGLILDEIPDMANPLMHKYLQGSAMGFMASGMIRGARETFDGSFHVYLSDAGDLVLRKNAQGIGKTNFKFIDWFRDHTWLLEPVQIAKQDALNFNNALQLTGKINKGLSGIFTSALKGIQGRKLKSQELNSLNYILSEGDTTSTVFSAAQIESKLASNGAGLSQKSVNNVVSSYYQMRRTLDLTHALVDDATVRTNGVDMLASNFADNIGKVALYGGKPHVINAVAGNKVKLTQWDIGAKGEATVVSKPLRNNIDIASLSKVETLIPYKAGFSRRSLEHRNYKVVRFDANGTTQHVLSTNSLREANRLKKNLEKNSEDGFAVTHRNISAGVGSTNISARGMTIMTNLGDKAGILRARLAEIGVDADSLKIQFDLLNKPAFNKKFAERTELGVAADPLSIKRRIAYERHLEKNDLPPEKLAALKKKLWESQTAGSYKPSLQGIADYIEIASTHVGEGGWRRNTIESFRNKYASVLDEGKGLSWDHPDYILKGGPDTSLAMIKEAKAFQGWMKRSMLQGSTIERWIDGGIAGMSEKLAAKNTFINRSTLKLLENAPTTKNLIQFSRALGAWPKLLMGNVAQIAVQSSQVAAVAGAHPLRAMNMALKMPLLAALHASRSVSGRSIPKAASSGGAKSTAAIYNDIRLSGIAVDLDTTDIKFSITTELNPSPASSLWGGVRSTFKTGMRIGAYPFRGGEAINRIMAFGVIRDEFIDLTLNSNLKRLDGVGFFKKDDILESGANHTEWLQAVKAKSQVFSLDMTKAGELELLSGVGSALGQFKQVIAKEIHLFQSEALSKSERVGAALGMMGFFGVGAIPLLPDILRFGDWAAWNLGVTDGPAERRVLTNSADVLGTFFSEYVSELTAEEIAGYDVSDAIKRFLEDGIITALSEGEINIANRIALGSFFTDMVNVQGPEDMVVSWAVFMDILEAADKLGVEQILNPLLYVSMLATVSDGEVDFTEEFAKFTPDLDNSILSQLSKGEIELGMASQAALRQVGKVHSYAGSISRYLDAAYKENVDPDYYESRIGSKDFYTTSSGKARDIEANPIRNWQLFFGITPGKLTEAYEQESEERLYREAIKDYKLRRTQDLRDTKGNPTARRAIMSELIDELNEMRALATMLDIDSGISAQVNRSVISMWTQVLMDFRSGGKM